MWKVSSPEAIYNPQLTGSIALRRRADWVTRRDKDNSHAGHFANVMGWQVELGCEQMMRLTSMGL